jgi:Uma2 family endonuclease
MSGSLKQHLPSGWKGLPAGFNPVARPIGGPDVPLLYEDEGFEEMGDSDVHTRTANILYNGMLYHFPSSEGYRVFANLNLYYSADDPNAYVSPDVMVTRARRTAATESLSSYRIGPDGRAPLLAMEVLSERTFQQRDLTDKPLLYARMRVAEYFLVDMTGQFLPRRLLLKRLRKDGGWADEQDDDSGVSSALGFRLIVEQDGQVRVLDAKTGKPYLRPDEAQAAAEELAAETRARRKAERAARAEAKARQEAEERARALEEELARLRKRKGKSEGS